MTPYFPSDKNPDNRSKEFLRACQEAVGMTARNQRPTISQMLETFRHQNPPASRRAPKGFLKSLLDKLAGWRRSG